MIVCDVCELHNINAFFLSFWPKLLTVPSCDAGEGDKAGTDRRKVRRFKDAQECKFDEVIQFCYFSLLRWYHPWLESGASSRLRLRVTWKVLLITAVRDCIDFFKKVVRTSTVADTLFVRHLVGLS